MKKLILLIVSFIPLAIAAQSYKSFYIGAESGHVGTGYRLSRVYMPYAGVEKYFKGGIKLSAAIGYTYLVRDEDVLNSQASYLHYNMSGMQIPLTIGYNVLGKKRNLQLFPVVGYALSYNFRSKSTYYNQQNAKLSEQVDKLKYWNNNFVAGIDVRYIVSQKFFSGAVANFSVREDESIKTLSVGLKVGMLF